MVGEMADCTWLCRRGMNVTWPPFHGFISGAGLAGQAASLRAVRGNGTLCPRMSELLTHFRPFPSLTWGSLRELLWGICQCLLLFGSQILPLIFRVLVLVCNAEGRERAMDGESPGPGTVEGWESRAQSRPTSQVSQHLRRVMLHLGRELVTGSGLVWSCQHQAQCSANSAQMPQ